MDELIERLDEVIDHLDTLKDILKSPKDYSYKKISEVLEDYGNEPSNLILIYYDLMRDYESIPLNEE